MIWRLASGAAWILAIAAWFWVDGDLHDPALIKEVLLLQSIALLLVVSGGRLPGLRRLLLPMMFFCWSLARIGPMASHSQEILGIATASMALLLGATGAVPPAWIGFGALGIAMGKGWDDLLFLRNVGGGIPFSTTSFFVHKNLFGLVLAPSLVMGISAASRLGRWTPAWWSALTVVALGFALLLVSDCRGALAGIAIAILGWSWLSAYRRWSDARAGWLLPATVGLGLLGVGLLGIGARPDRLRQTFHEAEALISGERVTTHVSERFRPWIWRGAIELWEESPWTGIGVGEFRYSIESVLPPWKDSFRDRKVRVDVAHSHWLQTLVERGLVGWMLEAGCVLVALLLAWRSNRIAVVLALAALSIHGLVSEGVEYPLGAVFWWYLIGLGSGSSSPQAGINVRAIALGGMILCLLPLRQRLLEIGVERTLHRSQRTGIPLGDAELAGLWERSPRSPGVLLEIAKLQAGRSRMDDALGTLDHLRRLYPRPGAIGMDLAYSGILRATGQLDSARAVTREMLSLYPNDAWYLHEWFRIERERGGCEAVRTARRPHLERMGRILEIPSDTSRWSGWRHRLVLDGVNARKVDAAMKRLTYSPWIPARTEWVSALHLCEDRP